MKRKLFLFLFFCLFLNLSNVKAEHFFSMNVLRVQTDEYPKIKLQCVLYLAEVFDDDPWVFNSEDFTIYENDKEIPNKCFTQIDTFSDYQIFELSYISESPLNAERETEIRLDQNGVHNGYGQTKNMYNGQKFIFKPSGEIIIPEEALENVYGQVFEIEEDIFDQYDSVSGSH